MESVKITLVLGEKGAAITDTRTGDRVLLHLGDLYQLAMPDYLAFIQLRKNMDGPPATWDRVMDWFERKGLPLSKQEGLDLLRIFSGYDLLHGYDILEKNDES